MVMACEDMRARPSVWNRDSLKAGLICAGLLVPYHWYLVRWETLSGLSTALIYSVVFLICLLGTVATALSTSLLFRTLCGIGFAASVLLVDSYQRVMDEPLLYFVLCQSVRDGEFCRRRAGAVRRAYSAAADRRGADRHRSDPASPSAKLSRAPDPPDAGDGAFCRHRASCRRGRHAERIGRYWHAGHHRPRGLWRGHGHGKSDAVRQEAGADLDRSRGDEARRRYRVDHRRKRTRRLSRSRRRKYPVRAYSGRRRAQAGGLQFRPCGVGGELQRRDEYHVALRRHARERSRAI